MQLPRTAILLAIFSLSAASAYACSCMREPSPEAQMERYDLVFIGTPARSASLPTPRDTPRFQQAPPAKPKRSFWQRLQFWKPAPPAPTPPAPALPARQAIPLSLSNPDAQMATRFNVSRTLKGPASQTVTIHHTLGNGANCGVSFLGNKELLIFAYRTEDGTYRTNSCASAQFPRAAYEQSLSIRP